MKRDRARLLSVMLLGWAAAIGSADSCGPCSLITPTANPPGAPGADGVDAAALVQAVRAGERWIHNVETLHIRMESTWSRATGLRAADAASAAACSSCGSSSPCAPGKLTVVSRGSLEYAIDHSRLYFLDDQPGRARTLKMWDGKQFGLHEVPSRGRESYFLDYTPQGNLVDIFASETSWPRAQPHSFWWNVQDVDELSAYYGRPSEFQCTGRQKYRGVKCHVLQLYPTEVRAVLHGQSYRCDSGMDDHQEHGFIGEVRGLANQSCRWYVGVGDGLLHGVIWSVADRPRLEHWMLDYQEVAPGCWYPMAQGYQIHEKDAAGRTYIDSRRDLKVLEIEVNGPLPDDLFHFELKEGVLVRDRREGHLVTYEYRREPPQLLGRPLPSLEGSFSFAGQVSTSGRPVLLCFWDMNQRPSRHCVRNLVQQASRLQEAGITVVVVHAGDVERAMLDRWLGDNRVPFPCATIADDARETQFAWNVASLPWLILTDADHVVKAAGFPLGDLDTRLAEVLQGNERWARISP